MDRNQEEINQNPQDSTSNFFKPSKPVIQGSHPSQIESNLRNINRPADSSNHQYIPYVNYQPTFPPHLQSSTPQIRMESSYNPPLSRSQPFGPPQLQNASSQKVRMRVSKACDRCRGQKIKCSGTMPCDTCIKHRKDCKYSTQQSGPNTMPNQDQMNMSTTPNKRIKLESPVPDGNNNSSYNTNYSSLDNHNPKHLPVTKENDYVRHLENRVQYLESILLENSCTTFKQVEPENKGDDEMVKKILLRSSNKWRYLRRHQLLLNITLCQSMYNELSEDNRKKVLVPRSQYFGWNMSGCNYFTSEELPELPEISLPNAPEFYFDFFFREINSLFAIIHEKLFRDQAKDYEKLFSEVHKNQNERDTKTNQTRLFLAIMFLVYALAIRFQEFQKKDGPNLDMLKIEEQLFKYSYKVISILSFEWESFELIQSWLLITLYLRVSHRQISSYQAMGRAIMMTRSMGLGKNTPKLETVTPYTRLKVKRIFCCVYTMDRILGLLSGKYCGLSETDISVSFNNFDFEAEKDSWITLPAFALMHIARISNFVHTSPSDEIGYTKLQQINNELNYLEVWLNENGFSNDALFDEHSNILPVVKAQVKLHYYDLINCIHTKLLFNYVGKKISNEGLQINMILKANEGVINVLEQVNNADLLYTPWYLFLSILFDTCISSITLINSGMQNRKCKPILQATIKLMTILSEANVKNEQGEVVVANRYTMAKECLWAMKMANRILSLRLEEDMKDITSYGIDHGSADVNRQMFNQFGIVKKDKLAEEKPSLKTNSKLKELGSFVDRETAIQNSQQTPDLWPDPNVSQPFGNPIEYIEMDNQLSNLQWFDQWLDYNYDM